MKSILLKIQNETVAYKHAELKKKDRNALIQ